MGLFFFDDSKHPDVGFCLGSFVYVPSDPGDQVRDALKRQGLVPGLHEFKSSAHMGRHPEQAALREELRNVIATVGTLGVVVVPTERELGRGALELLLKMLRHEQIGPGLHTAFFDQGVFLSVADAERTAMSVSSSWDCTMSFEQDSIAVEGIQLADLAAHTCSVMLRETLSGNKKMIKLAEADGYDDGSEFSLGFELWAGIRYRFLLGGPIGDDELAILDTQDSLHISESASDRLRRAAIDRFGSMYLGCIH